MSGRLDDGPGAGARMELRRSRRASRRRLLLVVLLVLAGLTAALTVRLATSPSGGQPAASAPQQRTQHTLLLQVQAPNGEAAATALLAHDPAASVGAVVLVPPQTLVTVPGSGAMTVGRALRSLPPAGTRAALADGMGVTVDAGWVMDQPSLGRLVDAVGGIVVDVDAPILRLGQLVLQPGSQRLDGARALVLLSYRAPEEQEQTRLARVQDVLDALLNAIPAAPADTARVLGGLGPRSIASLPLADLAAMLDGLKADDSASALQYDTLPVIPIDTGATTTTASRGVFRIDASATWAVVDRLLAGSVPAGSRSAGNRVLVLNGVGTPGLGEQVRAKLVPQGFVFVGSRNASRFGYARTQVLVPESTVAAQQLGAKVAAALGYGDDVVRSTDQLGSVADVVVLVGSDFRP